MQFAYEVLRNTDLGKRPAESAPRVVLGFEANAAFAVAGVFDDPLTSLSLRPYVGFGLTKEVSFQLAIPVQARWRRDAMTMTSGLHWTVPVTFASVLQF